MREHPRWAREAHVLMHRHVLDIFEYSLYVGASVMFFPLNAKQILWLRARPRQGSRTKKGYRTLTYACTQVRAGLETVAAIYLD